MSWAACWVACLMLRPLGDLPAFGAGLLLGVGLALLQARRWRRFIVAIGFPLSFLLSQGPLQLASPWAWAGLLVLLLCLYPRRSWVDAPMFPTPDHALAALPQWIQLPAEAQVLDAGCGMGHGLRALREVFPSQRLVGVEWSRPLAWMARWRCPWAEIHRGDMWAHGWRPYQLVYLFQRPESMVRALDKAQRELAPGTWLVSLDFELPEGKSAVGSVELGGRHRLWVYRF